MCFNCCFTLNNATYLLTSGCKSELFIILVAPRLLAEAVRLHSTRKRRQITTNFALHHDKAVLFHNR